jgi:hypothetical protein
MQRVDPERVQRRKANIERVIERSLAAIRGSELLLVQAQERLLRAREHIPQTLRTRKAPVSRSQRGYGFHSGAKVA